ncbi:MAG: GPW/gp25 family protein [Coprobacillus sp.]|nr:GPW/gp25 family protein [Coprobacillus sp.]
MANITAEFVGFDYMSASELEEIKRNIEFLLSTPAGTWPGDRNFGIDMQYIGMPGPIAQNQIALEITDKIDEYEPRVVVVSITSEHDEGQIKNVVRVGVNEDYEDDEENDDEVEEIDEE